MKLQEMKQVTARLVKAQQSVKKKYKLLKQGKIETNMALDPLKDLFKQVTIPPPPPLIVHPPASTAAVRPRLVVKRKRTKRRKVPYQPPIDHESKQEEMEEEDNLLDKRTNGRKIPYQPPIDDESKQEVMEEEEDNLPQMEGDYIKTEDDGSQIIFSNPSTIQESVSSTPSPHPTSTPRRDALIKNQLNEVSKTPEGEREIERYFRQIHSFARPYLLALMTGDKKGLNLDTIYGPKVNANGTLSLGSQALSFDRDYIYLNDKVKHPITEGLLNLLFLRQPDPATYTAIDRANYREFILSSDVARQGYSRLRPYNTSGHKYKYLLKDLLTTKKVGSGFIRSVNERPRYVYFDDPNELVDRLRLLFASQQAGNTAHDPEIFSIIEELKELNIII